MILFINKVKIKIERCDCVRRKRKCGWVLNIRALVLFYLFIYFNVNALLEMEAIPGHVRDMGIFFFSRIRLRESSRTTNDGWRWFVPEIKRKHPWN